MVKEAARNVVLSKGEHRPCRARPADRSLVTEDRSAAGVRDRTGPEPRACSRLAHGTIRHQQEWRGTAARGEEAKAQVETPARSQTDASEPPSNDS